MPRPDQAVPAHLRVLSRTVRSESGCLLWQGACQPKGYGLTCTGSRTDGTRRTGVLVHRIVWEATNGAIPDGLEVDHICRVRNCVEITHLQLLTPHANKMRADHTPSTASTSEPELTANVIMSSRKRTRGGARTGEGTAEPARPGINVSTTLGTVQLRRR